MCRKKINVYDEILAIGAVDLLMAKKIRQRGSRVRKAISNMVQKIVDKYKKRNSRPIY